MRLRVVSGLALLAALTLTPAQSAPAARSTADPDVVSPAETGKSLSTERDAEAVRKRDQERQALWDRKMKALTESVCTGC